MCLPVLVYCINVYYLYFLFCYTYKLILVFISANTAALTSSGVCECVRTAAYAAYRRDRDMRGAASRHGHDCQR